jgi:hypothetical protein
MNENEIGESEPSIEELERAQKEHEEKVRLEQEEIETQKRKDEELTARAGEDYAKRADLMAELKTNDQEAKNLQAQGIEKRIQESERLKGAKSEREELLASLNIEVDSAKERLSQIEQLVLGKNEEMIAETTKKALVAARTKLQELESQAGALHQEISTIGEQLVSDEMVENYNLLISKNTELNSEIDDLSLNPSLIEILHNEALTEDTIRDEIISSAKSHSTEQMQSRQNPERLAYVEKLSQLFITEELEAQDPATLKEQGKSNQILSKIRSGILVGLSSRDIMGYDAISRSDPKEQRYKWAGLLLKNLIGSYGTSGGTMNLLITEERGNVEHGQDSAQRNRENSRLIKPAVQRHLKSLNLVKSYVENIQDPLYRNTIIGAVGLWRDFDHDYRLSGAGYDDRGGSPLISRDATPQIREEMTNEYNKNKELARGLEASFIETNKRRRDQRIEELDKEIEGLTNQLTEQENNEKELKSLPKDYEIETKIRDLNNRLYSLNSEIKSLEDERYRLGIFGFRRRGQIDQEIIQNQEYIERLKKGVMDLEKQKERVRDITEKQRKGGYHTYQLSDKIRELKFERERLTGK